MKCSAVRELLKVTAQPEMISFAGGLPAAELLPLEEIRRAADTVLRERGREALQYAAAEGVAELRDWVAQQFSRPQLPLRRENVLIVSGAQQALDLLGRVLLDPGDKVIVENPTYLALLSAWRPLGVRFLAAPCDSGGMRVDALEPLLAQRPKLLYTIPNFQNPQGTTLTAERRAVLVDLLRRHAIGLVEDNPYGELRYGGTPIPHLFELAAQVGTSGQLASHVIHVGTFSKVIAPGLRVGWVVAADEVVDKLVQAKQACDLHTSTLNQLIVAQLLAEGFIEEHLALLRRSYCQRRDAMLQALEKYFPAAASWTKPDGGMFLLVTLPEGIDAAKLLPAAIRQNVVFVPGEEFHLDGQGRNTLRLNFSHASQERIEEGIRRLAVTIHHPSL